MPKRKTQRPTKKAQVRKSAAKPAATKDRDIIPLILEDHKALKKLIRIMKNSDKELNERKKAFEEFTPLLVTHAKPEEQTMYVFLKADEDLRENGFEGDVEHGLADQLLEEIKRTDDEDLWSARVKVLAELVEHHIKEEEEELLPEFKKHSEREARLEMGVNFMNLKRQLENRGGMDTPEESREKREQIPEIRAQH